MSVPVSSHRPPPPPPDPLEDELFLAMIADIRQKRCENTRAALILASAWLRTLLVPPRWLGSLSKRHGLPLRFEVVTSDPIAVLRKQLAADPHDVSLQNALRDSLFVEQLTKGSKDYRQVTYLAPRAPGYTDEISLSELVGRPCVQLGKHIATVGDVIKAVANVKGATHPPTKRARGKQAGPNAVLEIDESFFISNVDTSLSLLREVIDVFLIGISPLTQVIEDRYTSEDGVDPPV